MESSVCLAAGLFDLSGFYSGAENRGIDAPVGACRLDDGESGREPWRSRFFQVCEFLFIEFLGGYAGNVGVSGLGDADYPSDGDIVLHISVVELHNRCLSRSDFVCGIFSGFRGLRLIFSAAGGGSYYSKP